MWRKLALLTLMLVALISLRTQPVEANQGIVWNAEFYNNIYFIGTPTLSRQDTAITFNWAYGSPANGVNADNFSARWASDPYFAAGTYRFYALVDDNVCVWVNFQRLLDTFNQSRIGNILTADVTLTEGIHHVQVDYRENWGNAYLYVTWANLATNPIEPNFLVPIQSPPISIINSANSMTTQYYNNAALVGTPTLVQTELWPLIRNWSSGSPGWNIPTDNFSARWTSIQTLTGGTYRINARADDGVRVNVDGQWIINEFHSANNITYTADVYLVAGQHIFVVEYYEAAGLAFVEVTLMPVTFASQPQVIVNPSGTLTVEADLLNLRASPNCDCGVLAKVRDGETYSIVGRNTDSSWWQINVNGTVGWVFSQFTKVSNITNVPITDSSSSIQLPGTDYTVKATATAILRSHPGNRYAYIGFIATGHTADVIGRNADTTWWLVKYNEVTAWVSAALTTIEPTPNLNRIPVRS